MGRCEKTERDGLAVGMSVHQWLNSSVLFAFFVAIPFACFGCGCTDAPFSVFPLPALSSQLFALSFFHPMRIIRHLTPSGPAYAALQSDGSAREISGDIYGA